MHSADHTDKQNMDYLGNRRLKPTNFNLLIKYKPWNEAVDFLGDTVM